MFPLDTALWLISRDSDHSYVTIDLSRFTSTSRCKMGAKVGKWHGAEITIPVLGRRYDKVGHDGGVDTNSICQNISTEARFGGTLLCGRWKKWLTVLLCCSLEKHVGTTEMGTKIPGILKWLRLYKRVTWQDYASTCVDNTQTHSCTRIAKPHCSFAVLLTFAFIADSLLSGKRVLELRIGHGQIN